MGTEPGVKHDNEKPRMGLVLGDFRRALVEVVKIGTFGARKYSDHGWLSVPDGYQRYTDAMMRHLFQEGSGLDPESGLLHQAHAAWNALARLELMLIEGEMHAGLRGEIMARLNETTPPIITPVSPPSGFATDEANDAFDRARRTASAQSFSAPRVHDRKDDISFAKETRQADRQ